MDAHSSNRAGTGSVEETRPIRLRPGEYPPSYDGSLVRYTPTIVYSDPEVRPRAYLLTDDGGILAEISCNEADGPIVIGRGKSADIAINDPYVHRRQAEFRWDPETSCHFISHGGGANPTYVNRHRVHLPLRLIGGEHLRIGKTGLIYRIRR